MIRVVGVSSVWFYLLSAVQSWNRLLTKLPFYRAFSCKTDDYTVSRKSTESVRSLRSRSLEARQSSRGDVWGEGKCALDFLSKLGSDFSSRSPSRGIDFFSISISLSFLLAHGERDICSSPPFFFFRVVRLVVKEQRLNFVANEDSGGSIWLSLMTAAANV